MRESSVVVSSNANASAAPWNKFAEPKPYALAVANATEDKIGMVLNERSLRC
jgi:hypothetical protein